MGHPVARDGTLNLNFHHGGTEARRRLGQGIAGDELCKSLFFGDEPGGGRIVSHPFAKNAKGWATRAKNAKDGPPGGSRWVIRRETAQDGASGGSRWAPSNFGVERRNHRKIMVKFVLPGWA